MDLVFHAISFPSSCLSVRYRVVVCWKVSEPCDAGCSCSGSESVAVADFRQSLYPQTSMTTRYHGSPDVICQSLHHQVSFPLST